MLKLAMTRAENIIPSITDPLGSSWDQPSLAFILLSDTHAMMDQRTFEDLPEYSASYPSGVYEGKMWKRHNGVHDRAFIARGGKPEWMLCWYGPSNKPDSCSVNYRKILLPEKESDDVNQ